MKKRVCLSIVIVFCLTGIYAQEKKHSIGISVTPQINISKFKQKGFYTLPIEKDKLTGTGGALSENIYYQLQYKSLGFRIGFGYSNINFTYKYVFNAIGMQGRYLGAVEIKDRTERTFLSIPLSFFYDFYQKNKFGIDANAGIGVEFLVTENRFSNSEIGYSGDYIPWWRMAESFFSIFNLSANVGIDFKWTFDNGLGLGITPTCSYFFTNTISDLKFSDNIGFSEHYWLPGIACKAFYTFQKKDKQ
jgi:hypothetical protein